MREILFRGKRIDNGEWIYGDVIQFPMHGIVRIIEQNPNDGESYGDSEIDCDTLGQFTGLTDKNGKKIFEGDIVKETIASNYQPIGQIYYAPEFCQWRIGYINSIVLIGHIGKGRSYTILGNIHDNPELLEVTK